MSEAKKQRLKEYEKNYHEAKKLWFLVKHHINSFFFNFIDLIVYALVIYY